MKASQLTLWSSVGVLVTLLTAGVPALAAENEDIPAAKPYPEGINCVWRPLLRHGYYSTLDGRHVVLEASGRKYYLLTLTRWCLDLESSFDLGVQAKGGQLCGPGDSVFTSSDKCPIRYLEAVASPAEAEAIVTARKAAKRAAREAKKQTTDAQ